MSESRTVTVIPPSIPRMHNGVSSVSLRRRTAGYARVSTDLEEQQNSYEAQVDFYTNYIHSNVEWEFVKVYTDEGISATSTKKRDGFNSMVADALDGKIDLILTKSVSRFARNTVDTLTTVRKLKEKGVEIFFEKENIWTFDSKGELLITIMSSLAQEESRSISENVAWGWRKRMADGKVSMAYKQFLGYEKGPDGQPKVVESEAKTIRLIYRLFLKGMAYNKIARQLTAQGIPTPRGKRCWSVSTIESILKNEKYRGDAILQKTFTVDFLTKKNKRNEGELPQYYVQESHPAIIDPEVHEHVQREIARRAGKPVKNGQSIFSRRVVCGECGGFYGAKVRHSNDKYRREVLQCNEKYGSGKRCATPHVTEAALKEAFVEALNRLIADREAVTQDIRLLLPKLSDTAALVKEKAVAVRERDEAQSGIQECIEENASQAIDQREYDVRYGELLSRYEEASEKVWAIEESIQQRAIRVEALTRFIEELEERPGLIAHFDEAAWHSLAEQVTITADRNAVFRFKGGREISTVLH